MSCHLIDLGSAPLGDLLAAELTRPYDEAVEAEKSEGAKKTGPLKRGRYADNLLRSLFRLLKHHDPATRAKAAEELLDRVRRVKAFWRAIRSKYPDAMPTLAPGAIDEYSGFALSTVKELYAKSPWRVEDVKKMLIEATAKPWNDMAHIKIHEAFYAPKEHVDLDSFKVPVLRALAEHAEDASMREAAANLLRVREEAEGPKAAKRKRDAAEPEIRDVKKRQPLPFGYTESLQDLEKTMYDPADRDAAARAKAEIIRRELLFCAILCITDGGYNEIWNKLSLYCGFVRFSSAATEVREESMRTIAGFAFEEEHGEVFCTALATVLSDLLKVPDKVTLEDLIEKPLREVCGLSTTRGPVLIDREEYRKQIAMNHANVNEIIGSALKAELRRIDPDGDWVAEQ
jgi:hypothetical protein